MLKQLSIRTKFFLMGIFMSVAILTQLAGGYYANYESEELNTHYYKVKKYHEISYNMHRAYTRLISSQSLPPEFYKEGSYTQTNLFEELDYQSQTLLNELQTSDFISNNPSVQKIISATEKKQRQYRLQVTNIREKIKERGEYVYGIKGQLSRSLAELDSVKKTVVYNKSLFERVKHNYALFGANKQIYIYDELKKDIATLKHDIFAQQASVDYNQIRFLESLENFENKFDQYVSKELEIGFTQQEGLQAEVEKSFSSLIANIELIDEYFVQKLKQQSLASYTNGAVWAFLLIVIVALYILTIEKTIVLPALNLQKLLRNLSEGKDPKDADFQINGDFSASAHWLHQYVNRVQSKVKDIETLQQKNYESPLNSHQQPDLLSRAIVGLQNTLKTDYAKQLAIEEQDKVQDWITGGLAKFGDILRVYADNISELSVVLLRELVDYAGVEMGGVFIYDEEKKVLNLQASYAYNQEKLLEKQVRLYEGMIGTCAIDRKTLYLPDAPNNYIKIASGTGHTPPKSLLIVPMVSNERLAGVLELASIDQIEAYKIDFIERLAEDIADTLLLAQINEKNNRLLNQYQQQSLEMKAKEDKQKGTILKLEKEIKDKQQQIFEYITLFRSYNFLNRIEVDEMGDITLANEYFLMHSGFTEKQLKGKPLFDLFYGRDRKEFIHLWKNLQAGGILQQREKIIRADKIFWFDVLYVGLFDSFDQLMGFMLVLFDVSELVQTTEKLTTQNKEIDTQNINFQQKISELEQIIETLQKIVKQKNIIIKEISKK